MEGAEAFEMSNKKSYRDHRAISWYKLILKHRPFHNITMALHWYNWWKIFSILPWWL